MILIFLSQHLLLSLQRAKIQIIRSSAALILLNLHVLQESFLSILPKPLLQLITKLTIMPGIGKKSAQRIALHLLQKRTLDAQLLADQLSFCLEHLHTCSTCRNLCESTNTQCSLCMDTKRRTDILCVTETLADVISIEQTTAFTGTYFILHGKLSPIDRVGPEQLGIEQLLSRIQQEPIEEIILATSSTLEGNSTAEYIAETLSETPVRISRLATGIPLGTDFEYINQHTLFQALSKRTHWK